MTEIRPATAELLARFYGQAPTRTQRAVVAVDGERVIGVAGVYPDGARMVMFSELTDELKRDKRAIVRGIRAVRRLAPAGVPVHALADPDIAGSEVLLEHMGFTPVHGRVYAWQG